MTAELEHKAVEATTRVDSDLGEFAAIAATYDVDRVKDRIRFRGVREDDHPLAGIRQTGAVALGPPRRSPQCDRVG